MKKPPFIRTEHNYDTNAASEESALVCKDESLTQQHFAEEADINVIAKRYGLTGQLPQGVRAPTYGDFSEITDYRTALHAIREADDAFMKLPAEHRARWANDPQQFIEFASNEANREELTKMGMIITPPAPPTPAPTPAPEPKTP